MVFSLRWLSLQLGKRRREQFASLPPHSARLLQRFHPSFITKELSNCYMSGTVLGIKWRARHNQTCSCEVCSVRGEERQTIKICLKE